MLIIASGKSLSIIHDKMVSAFIVPELFGEITCFCFDGKLLWFGSTDACLRSICLSSLLPHIGEPSLSPKKLELKKYMKSNPISCLCLGDEN